VIKTFVFGIVLGVAATLAGFFFLPVVDLARETSVVEVLPNGGNAESFHINIPMDRIAVGSSGTAVPADLVWPEEFNDTSTELYKLRDIHDVVIGVAGRTVVTTADDGRGIEWVLHMPARGSVYLRMDSGVAEDGRRYGDIVAGTREFDNTIGQFSEAYAEVEGDDELRQGRIQLMSLLKATGGAT